MSIRETHAETRALGKADKTDLRVIGVHSGKTDSIADFLFVGIRFGGIVFLGAGQAVS